jgi:hypothetical protein
MYSKHNVDLAWKVEPIKELNAPSHQIQDDLEYDDEMYDDDDDYQATPTTSKKRPSVDKQEENRKTMLKKPEYLLVMSPELAGFSLKEKKWCKLSHPSSFARIEC